MNKIPLRSRAASWLRRTTGVLTARESTARGAAIVTYHAVGTNLGIPGLDRYIISEQELRCHMTFFRDHLRPIPLSTIIETLKRNEQPDPRWIAVTFDDGLLCQVRVAAPIMSEFDIPWSLSVPAALVSSDRTLWTYELSLVLMRCWKDPYLPSPWNPDERLPMRNSKSKDLTIQQVKDWLTHKISVDGRRRYMEDLIQQVGAETFKPALQDCQAFTMMSWDDVRRLHLSGVEILSHGLRHDPENPMMADSDLREDIQTSRRIIEQQIGKSPMGFTLPMGIVHPETASHVERAGYSFCLTSRSHRVDLSSPIFDMPRFDAEYSLPILRYHMVAPLRKAD